MIENRESTDSQTKDTLHGKNAQFTEQTCEILKGDFKLVEQAYALITGSSFRVLPECIATLRPDYAANIHCHQNNELLPSGAHMHYDKILEDPMLALLDSHRFVGYAPSASLKLGCQPMHDGHYELFVRGFFKPDGLKVEHFWKSFFFHYDGSLMNRVETVPEILETPASDRPLFGVNLQEHSALLTGTALVLVIAVVLAKVFALFSR